MAVYRIQKKSAETDRLIEVTAHIKKCSDEPWEMRFDLFSSVNITNNTFQLLDSKTRYIYPSTTDSSTVLFSFNSPSFHKMDMHSFTNHQHIRCYAYLLISIQCLIQMNILHYNIQPDNIGIHIDTPIIRSFNCAILVTPTTSLIDLGGYTPERIIHPPEVHLICYLTQQIKQNYTVITANMINNVIDDITGYRPPHLTHLAMELRKRECLALYRPYIGQNIQNVIQKLSLHHHHTWDVYALGMMYYPFFNHIVLIQTTLVDFNARWTVQQAWDSILS